MGGLTGGIADQRRLEQLSGGGEDGGGVLGGDVSGRCGSGSFDEDLEDLIGGGGGGGAGEFRGLMQFAGPGGAGGCQPLVPPDLLDVFKTELAGRAGTFAPRDIALSAWALATLNPQPDRFETRFDVGGDDAETTVVIGKLNKSWDDENGSDGGEPTRVPSLEPVEARGHHRPFTTPRPHRPPTMFH